MTGRCSRSSGFPAPPAPFVPLGLDPGVFQRPAGRLDFLPVWVPLMTSRSPSRTSSASPSGCLAPLRFARPSVRTSSHGFIHPSGAPSMENPLPDDTSSATCVPVPVPSRRGIPHPLRSASAVSHDPDGLRLSMPCDFFQSLTPLGLFVPLPCALQAGLSTDPSWQGTGFHPGGSWSTWSRVAAEATPRRPIPLRPPEGVRFGSSSPVRYVVACVDCPSVFPPEGGPPTFASSLSAQVAPDGSSAPSHRSGSTPTRSPRPRPGVASPVQSRPATTCYRCRGPVPSGTGPLGPAALPARRALAPRPVHVCWLSPASRTRFNL
jgi:hypothetical protein